MLRRGLKRAVKPPSPKGSSSKKKKIVNEKKIVGTLGAEVKDDAEAILEKLVLGGEKEILSHLEKGSTEPDDEATVKKVEEKKPAWEDEDDTRISIKVTDDKKFKHLKSTEKKNKVSGERYIQSLKNQFEKVSGTPSWAQLHRKKKDLSDDEDEKELLKTTGNYLSTSEFLPKGLIQMKKCTDVNKEKPSQGKLKSVEFHPTAQVMLAAGMDHTLNLFQVDGKQNPKIQSIFLDKYPIYTAHFTTSGEEVIMGSRHKSFFSYDMMAGKIVNIPQIKGIEENNMSRFKVSPDGKYIAFLGKYGFIHLISVKSKEWITSMKMNGNVEAIAFSRDGSQMYSFGDDGDVYVWDMQTRECIHKFKDEGCINGTAIQVSNNNQYVACGSYSGVVNVYDQQTCLASQYPKPVKAIMNLTTPCTDIKFNSNTEILAISSNYTENAVKLVHFPSMTVFSNFPDRTEPMRIPLCMDFSLNSGYFSIGNHKGQALLYRVKHYGNY